MKKKILYSVLIVVLLVLILVGFKRIFSFKYGDGIVSIEKFYELEENSVDVLILGSSHAFENINPMILWEDENMAAFDMCGSGTPVWNSYYHLKEALKTQSPKLVVLEGYALTFEDDYSDSSRVIKNVYGMKNSKNKLDALRVSVSKEEFWGFFLEYIQYHNRYKDIWKGDFVPDMNNSPQFKYWLGFADNYETAAFEEKNIVNDDGRENLNAKQEEYYKKIIDLCKENNIPLLTIVVPYEKYDVVDMHKYNRVGDIAFENGVDFVDFNAVRDDIGINFETDLADEDHLNNIGNAKFSHYLAGYLADNYELPKHDATDEKYKAWTESDEYYVQKTNDIELHAITNPDEYIARIKELDDNYTVIFKLNGGMKYIFDSDAVTSAISEWGISEDGNDISGVKLIWVLDEDGMVQCEDSSYDYYWTKRYGKKELLICKKGVFFDRVCYSKDNYGLNIIVFNKRNEYIADSVVIDKNGIMR